MLKKAAMVFGVVFILVGILGFVPGVTNDGMLLGIFHVDTLHNIIHLVSGIAALALAGSYGTSKIYFQVFGVIYALVAILGYFSGDDKVLGLITNNMSDAVLHTVIALVSLYLGFGYKEDEGMAQAPAA